MKQAAFTPQKQCCEVEFSAVDAGTDLLKQHCCLGRSILAEISSRVVMHRDSYCHYPYFIDLERRSYIGYPNACQLHPNFVES